MKTKYFIVTALLFSLSFRLQAQDISTEKLKENNITETTVWPETAYFQHQDNRLSGNEKFTADNPSQASTSITSAVGEITLNTSMANGAMTANVPIEVVPGIAGMTPEMALVYNNLSGNGVAGAGWNISGLYPVTYRNQSVYYNNRVNPAEPGFSADLVWEGRLTRTVQNERHTVFAVFPCKQFCCYFPLHNFSAL
ncbi:hypothetical protein AGMMS50262_00160 [Bacteroidia bacterium]|nr:hypothetical protein AGMMS50262_00160 [Bacteroidia bacterium]